MEAATLSLTAGTRVANWLAVFGERLTAEPPPAGFPAEAAAMRGPGRHLRLLAERGDALPPVARRGDCAAILDGSLDNAAEIRARLGDAAQEDDTDAQLIVDAYLRWGEDLFPRLRGRFALLVLDGERGCLLALRDPLGCYPLFHADVDAGVVFSTSLDALIRHPRVSRGLNRAHLADRLWSDWGTKEETCYASARRVPPGHVLRISGTGRRASRYWDPAPPDAPIDWIREGELDRFEPLFEQAVSRCVGDAPFGVCLSGGLDSGSVTVVSTDLARRRGLPPPVALSAAIPGASGREEEAIQRGVAAALGLPHVILPIRELAGPRGLVVAALGLSRELPAPLMGLFAPAYGRLARETRARGAPRMLTGAGGDEWLTVNLEYAADLVAALDVRGLAALYASFRRSYTHEWWRVARAVLWRFGLRALLSTAKERALDRLAPGYLRAHRRAQVARAWPAWLVPDASLRRELLDRADEKRERRAGPGGFYRRIGRSMLDHPATSMEFEDSFERSRRWEVEIRAPYWDADLVDFLYRVPPALLNRGGRSKSPVRQLVARRLPALGFARQRKDLRGHTDFSLGDEVLAAWREVSGANALAELGVVDGRELEAIATRNAVRPDDRETFMLWFVLTLEAWARPRL